MKQSVGNVLRHVVRLLPRRVQIFCYAQMQLLRIWSARLGSGNNAQAMAAIVSLRCDVTRSRILAPAQPVGDSYAPDIDICVVTHNSAQWVDRFVSSIAVLRYPKDRLHVHFVDNSSSDSTVPLLAKRAQDLRCDGVHVEIMQRPNLGFGSGQNTAIRNGRADLCLVTNIDLEFEPDSLNVVVGFALDDVPEAAAWELRQKPFEHPKFYDPVTGTTNWNSHACVLLRRSAIEAIGGYDEALFMYGEDVELSYRLRRAGYLLRYCPRATVWHHTYGQPGQAKPLQLTGSTFAALYLRLRYGAPADVAMVIPMFVCLGGLSLVWKRFAGIRQDVWRNLAKLIRLAPRTLRTRRSSEARFPFRLWDYEASREGAFVEARRLPKSPPKVTVITRTYRGRETYLRQALCSVARQTWPNVEHLVVEDGGDTMRQVVGEMSEGVGRAIRFIANGKQGRSTAGNVALAAAQGRWCVFLDDDDLLFDDHLETLASALLANDDAVAAYSLAWEVITNSDHLLNGLYEEITHVVPAANRKVFSEEALRHYNFLPIQSVLFERRLYLERGGFDADMDAFEDWVLWNKFGNGHHFVYVPKVTSLYRTHADPNKVWVRARNFIDAYPTAVSKISMYRQFLASRSTSRAR